jgi:hypothetical protein
VLVRSEVPTAAFDDAVVLVRSEVATAAFDDVVDEPAGAP